MNEQLVAALKQRIEQGVDKESIATEVLAAGHDRAAFEAAYDVAVGGADVPTPEYGTEPQPTGGSLIGAGDLISQSFALPFAHIGLIGGAVLAILAFAGIVGVLGGVTFVSVFTGGEMAGIAAVSFIVGYVLFIIAMSMVPWAIMRGLLLRREQVGFWNSLGWLFKNVIPASVVLVLMQLVTSGGMLLLIIPGVVLSFYLAFTLAVFVAEGKRGFAALLRSYDLVRGHWWGVFGRMLLVVLVMLVVIFAAIMVSAVVPILLVFTIPLVTFLALSFATAAVVVMYESLVVLKPASTFDASTYQRVKVFMVVLAVLGVVVFIMQMLGAAGSFTTIYGLQHRSGGISNVPGVVGELNSARNRAQDASDKALMLNARMEAELLYNENGYSYEGVCSELLALLPDGAVCNDSDAAYRAHIELISGEYFCVDSSGNADEVMNVSEAGYSCMDV